MAVCTDCGGTVIEYDQTAGHGFCVVCGTVVEENTIVNEIAFGETSTGAAMVQGSFVAQGATRARMTGPYGNRGNSESREQTIANAGKKIQSIANVLHLSEVVCLAATRLYTLAVEHKFTKGRKSMNVVAVCLYIACRQKETRNYMLIDFSDLLQVNVFELGHTYLQLVQTLNLRLPLVDPSHYISRFSALLEFGDETHRVAVDAVRIVQRFDRDWMTRGRRPAGICGAALLLAARMNNFRRSIEEIVQVVKIADTTLKKRLEEFKATPSGALTLADFRNVWLEEEMDPPAFTKGKEKEEAERRALEDEEEEEESEKSKRKKKKANKKRKGKRKRGEDTEDDEAEVAGPLVEDEMAVRQALDPSVLSNSILADAIDPVTSLQPPANDMSNIDPMLLSDTLVPPSASDLASVATLVVAPLDAVETEVSQVLTEEVSTFLNNPQGTEMVGALDEAEQRRREKMAVVDELTGLDEDELDRFILSEDEVKIKERVWVELNRDYLEALAAKGDQDTSSSKSRKRRKTTNKPRDSSNAAGGTAAESVRNLIKKNPKYSKRINYEALKDLFVDTGGSRSVATNMTNGDDDKDDADLLVMDDDKSDGEGLNMPTIIVEEEPGAVVVHSIPAEHEISGKAKKRVLEMDDEMGIYGEGSDEEKEDDVGWEDAYEQEV
ncbi:hypothetical protein CPB83DRAFT_860671 [Crepidotus variabilis]|uniref:B-related factor 1 n=1 Tax=Crepidotus variabilis TaxID=179855 RepID=A0A9P6E9G5_9AGAR|nr:hypothetical protein CPB83DRAFT_860671 [Crepidotus variabilis]